MLRLAVNPSPARAAARVRRRVFMHLHLHLGHLNLCLGTLKERRHRARRPPFLDNVQCLTLTSDFGHRFQQLRTPQASSQIHSKSKHDVQALLAPCDRACCRAPAARFGLPFKPFSFTVPYWCSRLLLLKMVSFGRICSECTQASTRT